jgi:very-short-patch-repair endonuclease
MRSERATLRALPAHTQAARVRWASRADAEGTRTIDLVDGRALSVARCGFDELFGAVSVQQRGLAARSQLVLTQADRSALDRRLRRGTIRAVHPGVYGSAHAPEIPLAAETAAILGGGPRALLDDHSAAVLHTIRAGTARPIHIVLLDGRQAGKLDGVVVHRSSTLHPRDARIHQGLPIVSAARALLAMAARLTDGDIARHVDDAIYRKLTTATELDDVLTRAGGHAGAARLRRAIVGRTGGAGASSDPEGDYLKLIRQAKIEDPIVGTYIGPWQADFYWPRHRLNIEVDAYSTHASRAAIEKDRIRDADVRRRGVSVERITRQRIATEPYAVVAQTVDLLARAEAA